VFHLTSTSLLFHPLNVISANSDNPATSTVLMLWIFPSNWTVTCYPATNILHNYSVSQKKTSPTFLAITRESIVRFS